MGEKLKCGKEKKALVKAANFTLARVFIVLGFIVLAGFQIAFPMAPADAGTNGKTEAVMPAWPHERSELKPDPDLIFGRLANGFRYVLMQNSNPKSRVSMHLNVQAGSLNESEEERGLAHFLEHMQFNGSAHFEPGELVKYFQRIGMQFGPDANAHTSFNETVYDILLPSGDIKSISDGLLVMRDFADGALLLQDEIEKESKVIISEMRSRDSADYRTLEATLGFEYPSFLLSKRLPIGIEETLRNADHNSVKKFYRTWYRPETMILVMVGDFDPKLVPQAVQDRFGDMKAQAPREAIPDFGKIQHKGIKSFYHYEKESGNTTVSIENITEIKAKSDSLALQKKLLIRHLADRIVQNRLNAMLKDPELPFTSAEIGSGQYLNKVQYAAISADCNPENWQKSMISLEKTLRAALIYGFQPLELERVKNDILSKLKNDVKKAPTRDSRDLARRIIGELNSDRVLQSPKQELDIFGPILEQVTLEQVNAAFRSVWSADHRLLLVTGNVRLDQDKQTPAERIKAVYDHSISSAIKAPPKVSAAAFPYLSPPEDVGKITSQKRIADLGIDQVDFANGLRLNVKQTDFKRNQVNINVVFGYGRSSEPADAAGISDLAQAVVNESGLGRLTTDELQTALAGKESQISFSVKEESFLISGTTVPDELTLLFELVYAYLVDPGFRESAYQLSMQRFLQRDEAMKKSVDGIMSMVGERFLADGDSRFGVAPYEELKKISLEQVEKWVRGGFEATPLEVSIVGDIDIDQVIPVVGRYLGNLPSKKGVAQTRRSTEITFPKNRSLFYAAESRIPKAMVVVAYPTADFWDIGRTRRLSALADLFSEHLRVSIREKMGVAYSPFAFNQSFRAYPDYGMLRAQITTDPDKAKAIAAAVKEMAKDISDKPISADELKRILDPLVNSIKDMRQTNPYWLNSVLTLCQRHPQQLEWSRTIENDYRSITAEDLTRLAKQYLKKDDAATVVIVPKESAAAEKK